jgi:hypothetical protein
MGPPTSIGIPASHRPGCGDSIVIAGHPPRLYQNDPADSTGPLPVLTPLDGSPYGTPGAAAPGAEIVYAARRNEDDLLYVTTTAGLGLWRIDRSTRKPPRSPAPPLR